MFNYLCVCLCVSRRREAARWRPWRRGGGGSEVEALAPRWRRQRGGPWRRGGGGSEVEETGVARRRRTAKATGGARPGRESRGSTRRGHGRQDLGGGGARGRGAAPRRRRLTRQHGEEGQHFAVRRRQGARRRFVCSAQTWATKRLSPAPNPPFSTGWYHQPVPIPLWYRLVAPTGTKGWIWRGS